MLIEIHKASIDSIVILKTLYAAIFPRKPDAAFLLHQPHYSAWLAYSMPDKAVGFILSRHILDEAEIIDMGVVSEYRHCGIAQTILAQVISDLKRAEIKRIFLEVDVTNQAAIQLYRRFGFVDISYRKGYYWVTSQLMHDAINMALNL